MCRVARTCTKRGQVTKTARWTITDDERWRDSTNNGIAAGKSGHTSARGEELSLRHLHEEELEPGQAFILTTEGIHVRVSGTSSLSEFILAPPPPSPLLPHLPSPSFPLYLTYRPDGRRWRRFCITRKLAKIEKASAATFVAFAPYPRPRLTPGQLLLVPFTSASVPNPASRCLRAGSGPHAVPAEWRQSSSHSSSESPRLGLPTSICRAVELSTRFIPFLGYPLLCNAIAGKEEGVGRK
ncbi:unnamed protein product [Protopolystoma xenopodis]|uniref:Uncharacterized protein n=1 Tax=Protopolystoma xenopodis TaxID=117903 RepID=A0A448WJN3_9PLAT|nr:unnamed protein product [Protopolystoma xenopodis]